MLDIYERLYESLGKIDYPLEYAGYNICYYYPETELFTLLSPEDQNEERIFGVDTPQAEIIVPEYSVTDKIKQMEYIISLLPKIDVYEGSFDGF